MVKQFKKNKQIDNFHKILYKPSFGPIGTWFWSFRSIENDFPIQMVPLWWILELGNDVSWRNNVWHKFFLYKPSFGPYGTWFWSSRSIENKILILLTKLSYCYLIINDVSWQNNVWHKFFLYKPCFGPYGTLFWPYHSIENCFLILLI